MSPTADEMIGPEKNDRSRFATIATPVGRGAIATILIAGHDIAGIVNERFRPASGQRLENLPVGRVCCGSWRHDRNESEEIVVTRSRNAIEIHCHGGSTAAKSIVESLETLGCAVIPWTDWLRRQTSSRLHEEAVRALAAATTRRTASLLLAQYQGALANEIRETSHLIEKQRFRNEGLRRIRQLIESSHVGLRLVDPWRVVMAGPPNVGKSSLINALAGFDRSIVYDQPGTTRDVIDTTIALDGWPIQLMDTAGLRTTTDAIEREGVSRAESCLAEADLGVLILDASCPTSARTNQEVLAAYPNAFTVMNKIDLSKSSVTGASSAGRMIFTSALTGQGLDELRAGIIAKLIPNPPEIGSPLLFTKRQLSLARQAERLATMNQIPQALARLKEIGA